MTAMKTTRVRIRIVTVIDIPCVLNQERKENNSASHSRYNRHLPPFPLYFLKVPHRHELCGANFSISSWNHLLLLFRQQEASTGRHWPDTFVDEGYHDRSFSTSSLFLAPIKTQRSSLTAGCVSLFPEESHTDMNGALFTTHQAEAAAQDLRS